MLCGLAMIREDDLVAKPTVPPPRMRCPLADDRNGASVPAKLDHGEPSTGFMGPDREFGLVQV
jgi:hypothetical protein